MEIPQNYIDDLLSRVDIVDVIDGKVALKRTGKNHEALCPFHQEKTPSFTVNPVKQFYYCFGCGEGGNAIGFIMDYDQVNFRVAVKSLAHNAGMTFEFDGPDTQAPMDPTASRQQIADNKEDHLFLAIYDAAVSRGDVIAYSDRKRHKLSVNRVVGFSNLYC